MYFTVFKKFLKYSYFTICVSSGVYFSKKDLEFYEKYRFEKYKNILEKAAYASSGFIRGFVCGGTIVPIIYYLKKNEKQ